MELRLQRRISSPVKSRNSAMMRRRGAYVILPSMNGLLRLVKCSWRKPTANRGGEKNLPFIHEYSTSHCLASKAIRTAVNARIRLENQTTLMTMLELDEVNGGFIEEVYVAGSS